MTKLAILPLTLAVSAASAEPLPYPRSVAPIPADKLPFSGHRDGNFMPNDTTKASVAAEFRRATGETVTIAADARYDNSNINDGIGAGSDSYTMYRGSGASSAGWPTRSRWVSFEDMFNNNRALMSSSCAQWGVANDGSSEIDDIYSSIQQVADETGLDHRFILAVMLQESGGCVRAPTSNYGVRNPGLMQCHDGAGTCNSDVTGQVQSPYPAGVITQMIREGAAGTSSGDGLASCVDESGLGTDADFYRAARIYNSGSVDSSGRLECGIATHCYASDIANRLTGWVNAAHGCTCDANPSSCGC